MFLLFKVVWSSFLVKIAYIENCYVLKVFLPICFISLLPQTRVKYSNVIQLMQIIKNLKLNTHIKILFSSIKKLLIATQRMTEADSPSYAFFAVQNTIIGRWFVFQLKSFLIYVQDFRYN